MGAESNHPLEFHGTDDMSGPGLKDSLQLKKEEDPASVLKAAKQHIEDIRGRADAKIRYAKVHLQELLAYSGGKADDYARSHQEDFFFHLFGALDAFTEELYVYYDCGLRRGPKTRLSRGKLRDALKEQNRKSEELEEIHKLEQDETSWLSHAKKMRNHSTHLWGVARTFLHGGVHDGEVWLKNPETLVDVGKDIPALLTEWAKEMESLLERLRKSAIEANKDRLFPQNNP